MSPEELLSYARDNGAEFVDLRWVDLRGVWRHRTLPLDTLHTDWIRKGIPLPHECADGQCAGLAESGARLVPVPETRFIDPFCQHPTLAVICDLKDAAGGADLPTSPRGVARRAEAFLESTGLAERAEVGGDLEFFVFAQVSYDQGIASGHYRLDSREGVWRRGRDEPDNLGTQLRTGQAAGCLPPGDTVHNLRGEMAAAAAACGVQVLSHQHGPATGGHGALTLAPERLIENAEKVVACKYAIRNVAARHGKVATFMPQPLHGERGAGLPLQLSLWNGTQALLGGVPAGGLSEVGTWAIGGLVRHARSLLAWTCPTTNSYKRLTHAHGGPHLVTYSSRDPAALIGVPGLQSDLPGGWIEFRAADPTCNPYLAFSAIVMAAADGIQNRLDPGPGLTRYLTSTASDCPVPARVPVSLEQALAALEADQLYLTRGNVFPPELIASWIEEKRAAEVEAVRARPHPYEFCLYFDA